MASRPLLSWGSADDLRMYPRAVDSARRAGSNPEFAGCAASFEAELDYVVRTLRRHGVTGGDAEDLAQEVFLVMWRRWADFDPSRPLRAWLAGIAFKVAHEHHKRARRWKPGTAVDTPDERPLPDEQFASARDRLLVLRALARMRERQRAILVMHDLDGLSMPEIAALLEVPVFTGYSRLRLARRSFARQVKQLRARRLDGAAGADAVNLLAAERVPPPVAPTTRRRTMSRVRALLAAPPTPAPLPPAPGYGWPVIGAAAAALLATIWAASYMARPRPASVVAEGLLGDWRFDEPGAVVRDLSGQGNDCVAAPAGTVPARTPGVRGKALLLDGHTWLECARPESLAGLGRELTIALWVRPTTLRGWQALVARQLGTGKDDYFLLGVRDGELISKGDLWKSAIRRTVPRNAGEWFHVAVVQGSDSRRVLYVDGVPQKSSSRSLAVPLGGGTSRITVGAAINGPDRTVSEEQFQGALDELRLYDRALSAAEVSALAARGPVATAAAAQ
jgi:RNA polymerase sigma-70 factor (ECF subfamily)